MDSFDSFDMITLIGDDELKDKRNASEPRANVEDAIPSSEARPRVEYEERLTWRVRGP